MLVRQKQKKTLFSFIILLAAMSHAFPGQDQADSGLEKWFEPNAKFWTWSPEEFAGEARGFGFRWIEENTAARAAPPRGTVFDKQVYEAVVRFESGVPSTFTCLFYSRGDSIDTLTEELFKEIVRDLIGTISKYLKLQPSPAARMSSSRSVLVRDDSGIWLLPDHRFELAFSYTPSRREDGRSMPFRAEYIRLTIQKSGIQDMPAHAITRVNMFDIRANIQRDEQSGDVWIGNVPMVDQGQKGYCAAAVAERVMLYFGQKVDQHQIAQIAGSSAQGGTDFESLRTALRSVGRQYNYSMKTHVGLDFRDFKRQIDRYNRLAANKKKPEIVLPQSGIIMINEIYDEMDADILVESRMQSRADYNRFYEQIKRYVNAGCPMAWGVVLGIVQEPELGQTRGGHLRLIIGYNEQTDEVIYSDSWGMGHELKRMPVDKAFAITTSLLSLEPPGLTF